MTEGMGTWNPTSRKERETWGTRRMRGLEVKTPTLRNVRARVGHRWSPRTTARSKAAGEGARSTRSLPTSLLVSEVLHVDVGA
jgi:hypothetical protein